MNVVSLADANSLFGKLCPDGAGFERHNLISGPGFALFLLRYAKMYCCMTWQEEFWFLQYMKAYLEIAY